MILPGIPVLNQLLQLSPAVSSFFDVYFQIAAPRISARPLFICPPGYHDKACHVNAVDWLAETVTNPSPASLSGLLFHRHLTRTLPQPFVTDDFR